MDETESSFERSTADLDEDLPRVSTETGESNQDDNRFAIVLVLSCCLFLIGSLLFLTIFGMKTGPEEEDSDDGATQKSKYAPGGAVAPHSGPSSSDVPIAATSATSTAKQRPSTRPQPTSAVRTPPTFPTPAVPKTTPIERFTERSKITRGKSPSTSTLKTSSKTTPRKRSTERSTITQAKSPSISTSKTRTKTTARKRSTERSTITQAKSPSISTSKTSPKTTPKKRSTERSTITQAKLPSTSTSIATTSKYTKPATSKSTIPTGQLNAPLTDSSLICTINCDRDINVPEDGLCDFLLYESLSWCDAELERRPLPKKLRTFVTLAASSKKTQYGFSLRDFDRFGAEDMTKNFKKQQVRQWIEEELLKNKVYHVGAMKMLYREEEDFFKEMLTALKEYVSIIKPFFEPKRIHPYTFLGVYGECQVISKWTKSLFLPDAIIVLGHIFYGYEEDMEYACYVVPPNIYKLPVALPDKKVETTTVYDGCKLAQCLRKDVKFQGPIALSFSLEAFQFVAASNPLGGNNSWLYEKCSAQSRGHLYPAAVCNTSQVNDTNKVVLDPDAQVIVSSGRIGDATAIVTFESSQTFRRKLCDAKFNFTNVLFTAAAYDVNYDEPVATCLPSSLFEGHYARVAMIKKLVFFLKNQYTDSSKHAACLAVT